MTEYVQQFRFYCRNSRCRMRLKTPVSNPREAFCTRGCHSSFYRKRCLVCEGEMVRRNENQLICGKRRCRNALSTADYLGRYHPTRNPESDLNTSIKPGLKSGDVGDRPWRIVAGAELTANQLHCATVPDGRNCEWAGGGSERLAARDRAAQREHIRRHPVHCPIPASWGLVFSDWKPAAVPLLEGVRSNDLGIPDFLRRKSDIYLKFIPQLPENTENPDFIGTIIIQKHTTNMSSVAFST